MRTEVFQAHHKPSKTPEKPFHGGNVESTSLIDAGRDTATTADDLDDG
jgi:hypothetical protein